MTEHDAVLVPAAELAELRRDAARYRWLRNSAVMSDDSPWCAYWHKDADGNLLATHGPQDGAGLDTLIDATMQKEGWRNPCLS